MLFVFVYFVFVAWLFLLGFDWAAWLQELLLFLKCDNDEIDHILFEVQKDLTESWLYFFSQQFFLHSS